MGARKKPIFWVILGGGISFKFMPDWLCGWTEHCAIGLTRMKIAVGKDFCPISGVSRHILENFFKQYFVYKCSKGVLVLYSANFCYDYFFQQVQNLQSSLFRSFMEATVS